MSSTPATASTRGSSSSNVGPMVEVHSDAQRELPLYPSNPVMETRDLNVFYGDFHAVHDVNLAYGRNEITAMIGPSGCGKSTVLRCLNRMNDLVAGARVEGEVLYHDQDIYAKGVDPIAVRTHIGMVFQKPNPFPKSIYDNIAYGPRVTGMKVDNMDDLVQEALPGTQRNMLGLVKLGASRTFVACSNAKPSARSVASLKAGPTNAIPIGLRPFWAEPFTVEPKPAGTDSTG